MKVVRTILLLAVLVVGGSLAYVYFSGGSAEPSTDLTTPELNATTRTAPEPETTAQAVETTAQAVETTAQPAAAFVLVSDESVASFELGEVLFGEAKPSSAPPPRSPARSCLILAIRPRPSSVRS